MWPCETFTDAQVVHNRAKRVAPKWSQISVQPPNVISASMVASYGDAL
jgi:hypothetical protein